jgi:hypothetical protein
MASHTCQCVGAALQQWNTVCHGLLMFETAVQTDTVRGRERSYTHEGNCLRKSCFHFHLTLCCSNQRIDLYTSQEWNLDWRRGWTVSCASRMLFQQFSDTGAATAVTARVRGKGQSSARSLHAQLSPGFTAGSPGSGRRLTKLRWESTHCSLP